LIDWLSKQEAARPRRVATTPGAPETAGHGLVSSAFGTGSAVLTGAGGSLTLQWPAGDDQAPRAVPAGDWHVRTVRIERSHQGTPWFLSMTAPDGKKKLRVEADRPAQVAAEASVHFNGRAERKGEGLQLSFVVTSADHRGLSVYRDGERIAVRYRVLAEDGTVLASGTMNYG
jgi:hypothetical protein